MLGNHLDKSKSAVDVFEELIPDKSIRDTIVYYEPSDESKAQILNMVSKSTTDEKREYLNGFIKLVDIIEKRFINTQTK